MCWYRFLAPMDIFHAHPDWGLPRHQSPGHRISPHLRSTWNADSVTCLFRSWIPPRKCLALVALSPPSTSPLAVSFNWPFFHPSSIPALMQTSSLSDILISLINTHNWSWVETFRDKLSALSPELQVALSVNAFMESIQIVWDSLRLTASTRDRTSFRM